MGQYSHTNLIGKQLTYGALLKELNMPGLLLRHPVNVLYMIELMNDRGLSCRLLSLSFSLRVNKLDDSRTKLIGLITLFRSLGYLKPSGVELYITETGRAALAEIERGLRRVMVRVRVSDPLLGNLTGPRKGVPMPKRWPDK